MTLTLADAEDLRRLQKLVAREANAKQRDRYRAVLLVASEQLEGDVLSMEMLDPTQQPAGQTAENKQAKGANSSKDDAQPAAARMSPDQSGNEAETNIIPGNASQVVDALGKALDTCEARCNAEKKAEPAVERK
jgi:hypothetical protein